MSAEKQPGTRRKFPFLEVYQEEADGLPPDLQGPFLMAVNRYGLNEQPPDFSAWNDDKRALLEMAWRHVEKWLQNGWTLSEKRSHPGKAGAPKGNQNARKKFQEERG